MRSSGTNYHGGGGRALPDDPDIMPVMHAFRLSLAQFRSGRRRMFPALPCGTLLTLLFALGACDRKDDAGSAPAEPGPQEVPAASPALPSAATPQGSPTSHPQQVDEVAAIADLASSAAWKESLWDPENPDRWPLAFTVDGRPSKKVLASWSTLPVEEKNDGGKRVTVLRQQDPATGLQLRVELVSYATWPVVEWTAFLENKGSADSPELRRLLAADVFFQGSEFTLHGIGGDNNSSQSFAPYEWAAQPGTARIFGPGKSGKSTNGPDGWPYFNLVGPADEGRILVLGWPGEWSATFSAENGGVRWFAGQERTHFKLRPGESVRFPSVTILFWQGGDWITAQNLWRRWYREAVLPHPAGGRQGSIWQEQTSLHKSQIPRFQRLLEAGIQTDICWMDAGGGWWVKPEPRPFATKDREDSSEAFLNTTGFWEPDPEKFPEGFAPFADWAKQHGMKSMLWFEPERIGYTNSAPGAYDHPVLATKHPEWLLPGGSHGSYFNLGDPAALAWLQEHLATILEREKIDWYREDFNGSGPYKVWRTHDELQTEKAAMPRIGLTENFYIQGHLALWDHLKASKPGLLLDSCAAGGRRNDLESMRRAVPLLRSDYEMTKDADKSEGAQGQTYGLSFWLPFYGGGSRSHDPYGYRSLYMPSFGMIAAPLPVSKKAYDEFRIVAPHMIEGDYYPLTSYNRAPDQWIAWQFHNAGDNAGVIQAFRRAEAGSAELPVRLRGLDPAARYTLRNLETAENREAGGAELMSGEFALELPSPRSAGVWQYDALADSP
jgi:alpha-galactosidase